MGRILEKYLFPIAFLGRNDIIELRKEGNRLNDIAKRIHEAISQQDISYGELSKATGIPKSALQRYATGNTEKIPLDRIESIAEALHVPLKKIMGWDDENEKSIVSLDDGLLKSLNERPLLKQFVTNLTMMDDDSINAFLAVVGLKLPPEEQ